MSDTRYCQRPALQEEWNAVRFTAGVILKSYLKERSKKKYDEAKHLNELQNELNVEDFDCLSDSHKGGIDERGRGEHSLINLHGEIYDSVARVN